MKTAWVFPGQGSQSVGMGSDLLKIPTAAARFEQAEQILGWSVSEICLQEDRLSQTLYTQPCLYVISAVLADLLQAQGDRPDLVAGHSLGEYVALYVAGVFSFETGLQLIKRRAELMHRVNIGSMMALIGVDRDQLMAQIEQTPNVVLANDNHPGQVVISGLSDAIATVLSQVKVRRVVPLKVSGAFHSPVVAEAAEAFCQVLKAVPFRSAQIPVISNVEPTPQTAADRLKAQLMQQMAGSVRWREISLRLAIEGVDRVVEVGCGNVLTGLIARTCEALILENVRSSEDLAHDHKLNDSENFVAQAS
ncbi:[acyl-carrier-protein] S-malonyltransferase [Phormidesmis priestleyi ULC007]|uniref:Malonyl CoA-acyl carrier protein transacylase n=1 Tax=Phormidesmis priestleyi ULC007 TaxID=1920490 RepID=A0A2T1DBC6_9CYAN|nr:ACP S-malonyltransferase [Phormidesmis priestleyi]PSB17757.1 [acyl-carrier-protein] S-malonyltransferase [Phormidesmis priestleyi ULC007]PZO48699.1 MAG: [acyl-carrier-protein] S-malonyltransferase [Phormidesmis priestleyi]